MITVELEAVTFPPYFRADCLELPGSPEVGIGATKDKAVINLLLKMLYKYDDSLDYSSLMIKPD